MVQILIRIAVALAALVTPLVVTAPAQAADAQLVVVGKVSRLTDNVVVTTVRYRCSDASPAYIEVGVDQGGVYADSEEAVTCDGRRHTFRTSAYDWGTPLHKGPAVVSVLFYGYHPDESLAFVIFTAPQTRKLV